KITLEDLAKVNLPQQPGQASASAAAAPGARQYGNISTQEGTGPAVADEGKSKFFLQGWFYLGVAGLFGALVGWGICEPAFIDGEGHRWGNFWIMPLVLTFMCLGFGVSESLVERSFRKAMWRGLLVLVVGVVFGIVFDQIAEIAYAITRGI